MSGAVISSNLLMFNYMLLFFSPKKNKQKTFLHSLSPPLPLHSSFPDYLRGCLTLAYTVLSKVPK